MPSKADALGRECGDKQELLTRIALFAEHCRELGCLDRAWAFPSAWSRFEYFRREDWDPHYLAHEDARCEVILLCGLPGSGKDTWLREQAPGVPVISLDGIREELGVGAGEGSGEVVQMARERAVPGDAIARMLSRWDVPAVTEAWKVEWWENGAALRAVLRT